MPRKIRSMIESPYAGEVERNEKYLARCVLDSLERGEAPFASHGFYTLYLDDGNPEQRRLGIESGLAWQRVADQVVFYLDYGWTPGMIQALDRAKAANKYIVRRQIGPNPPEVVTSALAEDIASGNLPAYVPAEHTFEVREGHEQMHHISAPPMVETVEYDCPDCAGRGWNGVQTSIYDVEQVMCNTCGGTGRLVAEAEVQ